MVISPNAGEDGEKLDHIFLVGMYNDTDTLENSFDSFLRNKICGGAGVMNWEIGIDIYTPICIKWITNKNLLYKKIN